MREPVEAATPKPKPASADDIVALFGGPARPETPPPAAPTPSAGPTAPPAPAAPTRVDDTEEIPRVTVAPPAGT